MRRMFQERISSLDSREFAYRIREVLKDPSGPKFASILADPKWFGLLSPTGRDLLLEALLACGKCKNACETIEAALPLAPSEES